MAKSHRICSVPDCGKNHHANGYCRNHNHRFRKYGDPTSGPTSNGEPISWLQEHASYTSDDCLTWPFGRRDGAYGRYREPNTTKQAYAHREMCRLAHGEPPSPSHEVAHSCGKGHEGCVNPRHLRWDTRKGNCADRVQHGTENRGERNGQAKLTESSVRRIRAMASKPGTTQNDVAEMFGISRAAVSDIVTGRRWGWLK